MFKDSFFKKDEARKNQITQWSFPTATFVGTGARNLIPAAFLSRSLKRPLIVTDRGIAKLPLLETVLSPLQKEGLDPQVFSEIWGNPLKSQLEEGVKAYHAMGADSILALGGGAAIDVAKAIALMVHHPGDLFDYEDGKPDARLIDQEIPFWVAVPTTAGTGSEVGRSTVISDDETKIKKIIFSPRLLAQSIYVDPELTLNLPAFITATTGMDALTHLIEAYLAKGFHPICDGIALEGIRLVSKSLLHCVEYAKNAEGASERHLEARGMMLTASLMGAIAFQKGLGVTHSCAHALSTVADLHHGYANGVLLPHMLRFNASAEPERFQKMAQAAELNSHEPEAFIRWIEHLRTEMSIPHTFSEKKEVSLDHIPDLVEIALADGCHASNPRLVTREDFTQLFEEAIGR
jgi:alcohol dehydrogenase class IV